MVTDTYMLILYKVCIFWLNHFEGFVYFSIFMRLWFCLYFVGFWGWFRKKGGHLDWDYWILELGWWEMVIFQVQFPLVLCFLVLPHLQLILHQILTLRFVLFFVQEMKNLCVFVCELTTLVVWYHIVNASVWFLFVFL